MFWLKMTKKRNKGLIEFGRNAGIFGRRLAGWVKDFRIACPEFQNNVSGISEQKIVRLGRDFQNWENWELSLIREKRIENWLI